MPKFKDVEAEAGLALLTLIILEDEQTNENAFLDSLMLIRLETLHLIRNVIKAHIDVARKILGNKASAYEVVKFVIQNKKEIIKDIYSGSKEKEIKLNFAIGNPIFDSIMKRIFRKKEEYQIDSLFQAAYRDDEVFFAISPIFIESYKDMTAEEKEKEINELISLTKETGIEKIGYLDLYNGVEIVERTEIVETEEPITHEGIYDQQFALRDLKKEDRALSGYQKAFAKVYKPFEGLLQDNSQAFSLRASIATKSITVLGTAIALKEGVSKSSDSIKQAENRTNPIWRWLRMKMEIPNWVAIVVIVVLVLLAGFWLWQGTSKSSSEVVVPKTFGSESDPYGSQGRPMTPSQGQGASEP